MDPGGLDSKESACNEGDLGSIPWLGRSPKEGNVKMQNYKLLEDSTGEIADDLEHDDVFLNIKDGNHERNN